MIIRCLITGLLVVLIAVVWFIGTALERATNEARDLAHQSKLLVMSTRGLTFDIRKNITTNVEMQARIIDSLTGSMDRMSTAAAMAVRRAADRLDRLADTMEAAACSTAAGTDQVLDEAAVTIRAVRAELLPSTVEVLDGAVRTLASARGVADQARAELEASGREIRQAVGGVRPMLDATTGLIETGNGIAKQGERGATSAANVFEHYEKMILHPSTGQKIKGWLQLFLSGMTVWANSKTIF